MNENEFLKIFAESFDELNTAISIETKFKELEEWNSMQALLMIAHIDDTLAVVLEAEDIKNAQNLNDIYQIVKSKM